MNLNGILEKFVSGGQLGTGSVGQSAKQVASGFSKGDMLKGGVAAGGVMALLLSSKKN